MTLLYVCELSDLPVGQPMRFDVEDLELAVFNIGDKIYVIDDRCTHGPGSLSEGEIKGHVIECDFHQGGFDIRTGEAVIPPCLIPVRTYAVHTEDGKVFIDSHKKASDKQAEETGAAVSG